MNLKENLEICEILRNKILDIPNKRILISKIKGSQQENDLTLPPNCNGFGRIRHFYKTPKNNWVPDPLPNEPACHALGIELTEPCQAQVFQIAACNLTCWYCFVPRDLLNGDQAHAAWFNAKELLDLYLFETNYPKIFDFSGGHPDLAPEWVLWVLEETAKRKLSDHIYFWSDDNLTTDFTWQVLKNKDKSFMVNYKNFGRVGCFKGFDEESFYFNTHGNNDIYLNQFNLMKKLIDAGFDTYAYATFTTDNVNGIEKKMKTFVDRLQNINEALPLRTVPLQVMVFEPMKDKLNSSYENAIQNQFIALQAWKNEIETRFTQSERNKRIYEIPLKKKTEINSKPQLGFSIDTLLNALRGHYFWLEYLKKMIRGQMNCRIHLAIFVEPFLKYVLDGTKTVESRFSKPKIAPYKQVRKGDIVLLKRSGGPIVGICLIEDVWFYELDPEIVLSIKDTFSKMLCAQDPEFWEQRTHSAYASLMRLDKVTPILPLPFKKNDRRGWLVLSEGPSQKQLTFGDSF